MAPMVNGRDGRIEWVLANCRLLVAIGDELERTRPFDGLLIGTGIHLEPKTVALLLTLRRGGAEVVATGNLNTTQQEAVDYLEARGVRVVGGPTSDPVEHDGFLRELLAARPQLLLDNGGDLFVRFLEAPYDGLRGGTEETTSGRMRLEPLRELLGLPILVINDSPIKQFARPGRAAGGDARRLPRARAGRRAALGRRRDHRHRRRGRRDGGRRAAAARGRDPRQRRPLPLGTRRGGNRARRPGAGPQDRGADRRAHGQPRRPPPARELDRVDGPRLRPPDALSRG